MEKRVRREVAIDLEFFFLLGILIVSVLMLLQSTRLDATSAMFPEAAALVTLLMTLLLLALQYGRALWSRRPAERPAQVDPEAGGAAATAPTKHTVISWPWSLVMLLAYLLAMTAIGFIAGSLVFFAAATLIMGTRVLWKAALFSVASTAILVLVFQVLFKINLPDGALWAWLAGS